MTLISFSLECPKLDTSLRLSFVVDSSIVINAFNFFFLAGKSTKAATYVIRMQ